MAKGPIKTGSELGCLHLDSPNTTLHVLPLAPATASADRAEHSPLVPSVPSSFAQVVMNSTVSASDAAYLGGTLSVFLGGSRRSRGRSRSGEDERTV